MLILLCRQSSFALLLLQAALIQCLPPLQFQLLSMLLLLLLLALLLFPHVVDLQH